MDRTATRSVLKSITGKFYVYVLARPEGTPFYVGKGKGDRIFQHEAEALNPTKCSHKLNLIRSIHQRGEGLRYSIAGHFSCEEACLKEEERLVSLYGRHDLGLGPLTNQIDGGAGGNPSAEVMIRRAASLGGAAADPECRAGNAFLASIAGSQDSVPVKAWSRFRRTAHLLRPSPNKPTPKPKLRMAKAIAATALANNILLGSGVVLPRRFTIDEVDYLIENGCGGDMIHSGMVESVEPRLSPFDESLRLTEVGFSATCELLSRERLVDLGILLPD
ncbi:GIY-YIG nuclease family protein [Vannielia litorea]|uniref:GIY-YIG nuclease family protein n=1 Tax=Vannielia litorea TaxID=1217970 RepID=UPI003F83F7E0